MSGNKDEKSKIPMHKSARNYTCEFMITYKLRFNSIL